MGADEVGDPSAGARIAIRFPRILYPVNPAARGADDIDLAFAGTDIEQAHAIQIAAGHHATPILDRPGIRSVLEVDVTRAGSDDVHLPIAVDIREAYLVANTRSNIVHRPRAGAVSTRMLEPDERGIVAADDVGAPVAIHIENLRMLIAISGTDNGVLGPGAVRGAAGRALPPVNAARTIGVAHADNEVLLPVAIDIRDGLFQRFAAGIGGNDDMSKRSDRVSGRRDEHGAEKRDECGVRYFCSGGFHSFEAAWRRRFGLTYGAGLARWKRG